MPSSSKAKGTPQPSLQKTPPATNAPKGGDDRSANILKASAKSEPPTKNFKVNVNPGGEMTHNAKGPAASNQVANNTTSDAAPAVASGGVNRKKQKRREKQAARLAAGQQGNSGYVSGDAVGQNGHLTYTHGDNGLELLDHAVTEGSYPDPDFDDPDQYVEGEDLYYTDDEGRLIPTTNGTSAEYTHGNPSSKSKKKKKSKNASSTLEPMQTHHLEESSTSLSTPSASIRPPPPPPPPLSNAALRATHKISRDRIWNTSTAEERERIKEFWLSLGEEERRSLVKVEKEAVLRKMKEQQKHSCSCTVCGRKRTAIEEELEVLYDAYYEELEQYANHNQGFGDGAPIMPPPRMYSNPMASDRMAHLVHTQLPSRGKVTEPSDDEDADDEDYDDEDDEVDYSDDELDEEITPNADFFTFGNSLTVKEGILTVADDLLKNDGRKFIDMMEQLAERRMQREEETQYAASALAHPSMHAGHNHGPPLEEEDDEFDDEDDDYVSEEDDYEDDDMETMTEEQRMEEGRRMFQIFAARMFEQRVLTAYREKVARERQQKLIEELEEESRLDVQREAKKAREAQKKKDKKKLQKQAKEEEKAKREAEKAAEEAKLKAIEEKKQEEQKQRREEQRKKKESEKKTQEEERAKKEAEKQRRLQEERDRQTEAERKLKEQKEREKKKKDEAKKKEREEREAKEKESRERKAQEERERKAREEQIRKDKEEKARKDREAAVKADKEAKDRARREEAAAYQIAQSMANQKRPSQTVPVHLPPGLHPPQGPSNLQSPHFQVATPVVPKAPTPVRQRQTSQQGSHASSPRSQQAVTDSSHSASPGNAPFSQCSIPPTPASAKSQSSQPPLIHPQPSAPMSPIRGQSGRTGSSAFTFEGIPNMSTAGLPTTNAPMMPPGMPLRGPMGNEIPAVYGQPLPIGGQYRNYPQNGMPMPPGINGNRVILQTRGFPMETTPSHPVHPQSSIASSIAAASREPVRSQPHSRQQSASYDKPVLENINTAPTQPIGRPAPIKRPSSTTPNERSRENSRQIRSEMDDLSAQLGSSALLDDTDTMTENMHIAAPPGAPGSGRAGHGASPLFPDMLGSSKIDNHNIGGHGGLGGTWNPQLPFGAPGLTSAPTWGNNPGWTASNNAFGIIGGPHRPHASRPVTIRLMVSQACKQLTAKRPPSSNNGFHNVKDILQELEHSKPPNEPPVSFPEMMEIFDTEGNPQNGGGSFLLKNEGHDRIFAKFEPHSNIPPTGPSGKAGDIGSPIPSSSYPAFGGVGSRQPFQSSPPTDF